MHSLQIIFLHKSHFFCSNFSEHFGHSLCLHWAHSLQHAPHIFDLHLEQSFKQFLQIFFLQNSQKIEQSPHILLLHIRHSIIFEILRHLLHIFLEHI